MPYPGAFTAHDAVFRRRRLGHRRDSQRNSARWINRFLRAELRDRGGASSSFYRGETQYLAGGRAYLRLQSANRREAYQSAKREHACFCGSRRCRGTMLGEKRSDLPSPDSAIQIVFCEAVVEPLNISFELTGKRDNIFALLVSAVSRLSIRNSLSDLFSEIPNSSFLRGSSSCRLFVRPKSHLKIVKPKVAYAFSWRGVLGARNVLC